MKVTIKPNATPADLALIATAEHLAGLYKLAEPGGQVEAYILRRSAAIVAQLGYDPIS